MAAIIGFPRIGKNRELKFETEKYFKNEISLVLSSIETIVFKTTENIAIRESSLELNHPNKIIIEHTNITDQYVVLSNFLIVTRKILITVSNIIAINT